MQKQHYMTPEERRDLRSCTISRGARICETKSLSTRQKNAGILDVFQAFLTMPTAILAAKMRAEAIGTASKRICRGADVDCGVSFLGSRVSGSEVKITEWVKSKL